MAGPRSPKGRARRSLEILAEEYPGSAADLCELNHRNAFELLVATILSAQSTDKMINSLTPALFARYPGPEEMSIANPEEMEGLILSSGFFRQKSKSLIGMAQRLLEHYGGEVPHRIEELVTLPGVGRKTANVLRSVALGEPGFPVDTHVGRLVRRLGITDESDPVKVEMLINQMVPAAVRGTFSLRLILHGRRLCGARNPLCGSCALKNFCPRCGLE